MVPLRKRPLVLKNGLGNCDGHSRRAHRHHLIIGSIGPHDPFLAFSFRVHFHRLPNALESMESGAEEVFRVFDWQKGPKR